MDLSTGDSFFQITGGGYTGQVVLHPLASKESNIVI